MERWEQELRDSLNGAVRENIRLRSEVERIKEENASLKATNLALHKRTARAAVLEAAMRDALGRHQVTHIHAGLKAALSPVAAKREDGHD